MKKYLRKPRKTLMHTDNWELYASPLGKNMFCGWESLSVVTIEGKKGLHWLFVWCFTQISIAFGQISAVGTPNRLT